LKTLGEVARNTVDGDSALRVVIETNPGTRLCGMGFPNNETECCLPGRIYPGDRAKATPTPIVGDNLRQAAYPVGTRLRHWRGFSFARRIILARITSPTVTYNSLLLNPAPVAPRGDAGTGGKPKYAVRDILLDCRLVKRDSC
jgi:hypothetical protein